MVLGVLKLRACKGQLFCVLFWHPSKEGQGLGGEYCHFLRRYQINKKLELFWVAPQKKGKKNNVLIFGSQVPQFKTFVFGAFFGISPGQGKVFKESIVISVGGFSFLVHPPGEGKVLVGEYCHFVRRYQETKKTKFSLVFFFGVCVCVCVCVLVLPQEKGQVLGGKIVIS